MMGTQGPQGGGGGGNMADMLNDLMRSKPNFSTDVFGGQVYQSKFKPYWLWSDEFLYWELINQNDRKVSKQNE